MLHNAAGAPRQLWTVAEAAAYLGVTEKGLRSRIERARRDPIRHFFRYRTVGRSIRFLPAELEAWTTHARTCDGARMPRRARLSPPPARRGRSRDRPRLHLAPGTLRAATRADAGGAEDRMSARYLVQVRGHGEPWQRMGSFPANEMDDRTLRDAKAFADVLAAEYYPDDLAFKKRVPIYASVRVSLRGALVYDPRAHATQSRTARARRI